MHVIHHLNKLFAVYRPPKSSDHREEKSDNPMSASKTPKARHARLLSNGFFPPEMPSCFYSERFGANRDAVIKAFDQIPSTKKGQPHFHLFKSERAVFNFPRFGREDRRHSYINPVSYFYLSKLLAENYVAIRKLNRRSKISVAPAIFDWAGERALIRPAFDARDAQRVTLNAGYELLAEADIAAFFHSVYTHTIPWAIHGKPLAKRKKQDMNFYGNVLDLLVRNAQDGQTIGLPVGPDTSRLLAEIVGTAVDKAVQTALKGKRNWSAKQRGGMRFVDDFTFGCSSQQEAEIVVAAVRRCANEFELELNNTKTRISPTGPFFPAAWKEHIRSLLPAAGADRGRLLQYFYGVEAAVRAHPEANVQKFALQNARRHFLETAEWRLVEDYLLSSYQGWIRQPSLCLWFRYAGLRHCRLFRAARCGPHRLSTKFYRTCPRFLGGRLRSKMLAVLIWLFAALSLGSVAFADDLSGQASIIDGDTLEIHRTRIRLWGIDAPESNQLCRGEDSLQYRCGANAANELDAFLNRRPINCVPLSLDVYGRTVATCSVDGVDLGDWLVRNGLALDWPTYSKGKYDKAQRDADHEGRGIWAGSYVAPWLFRACMKEGGKPRDCSDDANSHP
jgi:endonuclease YncB( thermonuclease family)